MNVQQKQFKNRVSMSLVAIALMMALFSLFVTVPLHAENGAADEEAAMSSAPSISQEDAERQKWGLLSAALAFGFGALGAGMAISKVGSAAMGAMSERPEIGSQALIFVAMAEGIVIFGFISALMILGKF